MVSRNVTWKAEAWWLLKLLWQTRPLSRDDCKYPSISFATAASSQLSRIWVFRERPLDSQGGLGFFWKKYSGSGFGQKKYAGLDHVWKKISWLYPLKKKCLPSIHEKKMSALYIHENKMLALYKWYYHGSRTNLIFVSLSWSWWRNVGR